MSRSEWCTFIPRFRCIFNLRLRSLSPVGKHMEHAADLKAFEEQLQAGTPPHALEGFSRIHAHENAL